MAGGKVLKEGGELAVDVANELSKRIKKEISQRANQGDELAMDYASRMQRAKDMGFDTDTVYYHGTKKDFNEFSLNPPERSAVDSIASRQGVWASTSPSTANIYSQDVGQGAVLSEARRKGLIDELAKEEILLDNNLSDIDRFKIQSALDLRRNDLLSDVDRLMAEGLNIEAGHLDYDIADRGSNIRRGLEEIGDAIDYGDDLTTPEMNGWYRAVSEADATGGNVTPFYSRGNIKEVDLKGKNPNKLATDEDQFAIFTIEAEKAKKEGYDGVKFNNVPERLEHDQDAVLFFKPEQLRSINAMFDRAKQSSANLLASKGAGITTTGALGTLALSGLSPQQAQASEQAKQEYLQKRDYAIDPVNSKLLGFIADTIESADRNIDGPLNMLIPVGVGEWARKGAYGEADLGDAFLAAFDLL